MDKDNELILNVGTKVDINGLIKQIEKADATIDVKFRSIQRYEKKQSKLVEGTPEYIKNAASLSNAKEAYVKASVSKLEAQRAIDAAQEQAARVEAMRIAETRAKAQETNSKTKKAAEERLRERENRIASGGTSSSTTKLQKFMNKFKNILLSRIIRSAINTFVKAMKEGVNNIYQWSKRNNGSFSGAMDSIASSFMYIKNAAGALVAPALEALAPIIEKIANAFARATEKISLFFAVVSGRGWYYKAVKSTVEYASAVGELKNQLLGFDELNVLSGSSSSSSSGMFDFVQENTPSELTGFLKTVSNIKKKIEELKDGFDGLPENIKALAAGLAGSGLAALLALIIANMNKKNKSLKTQTGLTKSEASAVDSLSTALETMLSPLGLTIAGLVVGAGALTGFKNPLQQTGQELGVTASAMENLGNVTLITTTEGVVGMQALGDNTQSVLDEMSLSLDSFITNSLNALKTWADEVGSIFTSAQNNSVQSVNGVTVPQVWNQVSGATTPYKGITTRTSTITQASTTTASKIAEALEKVAGNMAATALTKIKEKLVGAAGASLLVGASSIASLLSSVPGLATLLPSLFANGGIPAQGSMFIAGEAGPEYVASINGRTQVYNEDQLAGSLASANAGVINTLTAVGNAIVTAINRKDTSISTNDVRNAVNNMNMRYGL